MFHNKTFHECIIHPLISNASSSPPIISSSSIDGATVEHVVARSSLWLSIKSAIEWAKCLACHSTTIHSKTLPRNPELSIFITMRSEMNSHVLKTVPFTIACNNSRDWLTTTWPWQLIRSNLIPKTGWRHSVTCRCHLVYKNIRSQTLTGCEIRHVLLYMPFPLYLCAVSCPTTDPISGLSSAIPPQHMAFNLLLRPGIRKSSSHFRQPWTLQ